MSTDNRLVLNLLGEQVKSTNQSTSTHARLAQLRNYLRGLPSLALSEKGRAHVCHRFGVREEELAAALSEQEAHQGQPAQDLLHITISAINGAVNAEGGAATC